MLTRDPDIMKSASDLIAEAKQRIKEISPRDAVALHQKKDDTVFVDVREPNEYNLGHVPGAVFIPRGTLEGQIEQRVPRDKRIVLYCAGGNRSALAADTLAQMGYSRVESLAQGWRGWVNAGGTSEG